MKTTKNKPISSLLAVLIVLVSGKVYSSEKYEFKIPVEMNASEKPKENGEEWRQFFLSANKNFKHRQPSLIGQITAYGVESEKLWMAGSWTANIPSVGLMDSELPRGTLGLNTIGGIQLPYNKLTNVDFMAGVVISRRNIELQNNMLENLKGLSNLKIQYDYFHIDSNMLTSLNGLENLEQIRTLHFFNNPRLTDISAISNIKMPGSVYMDNPKQYKKKPRLGSPFCDGIRDKKIWAYAGTIFNKGPALKVGDVCEP